MSTAFGLVCVRVDCVTQVLYWARDAVTGVYLMSGSTYIEMLSRLDGIDVVLYSVWGRSSDLRVMGC